MMVVVEVESMIQYLDSPEPFAAHTRSVALAPLPTPHANKQRRGACLTA